MKKQAAQKKPRTKKTAASAKEIAWHVRARELPLALFHTTVGPIIGRVERVDGPDVGAFNLRLWAPAALRMAFEPGQPGVTSLNSKHMVTFQPMALVETYLDLSSATPFGRSPVPDALIPSYDQYFEKVVLGEYSFTRVVAHVQQGVPHEVPVGTPATEMSLPWAPGSDPHAWLTRKVYNLGEDEIIERDDPRRVLVKRSFFGWAYQATAQKVAEKFDFDVSDVQRAYDMIDEAIPVENQVAVKAFLKAPPRFSADPDAVDADPSPVDKADDESTLS